MTAPEQHDNSQQSMVGLQNENSGPLDVANDKFTAPLQLAESERLLLSLHDRLEEVKLDMSLLKALETVTIEHPEDVTEAHVRAAQEEMLQAKALYSLRNNIVGSVLVANPILKAVHARGNATLIERDLEPIIQARDEASVSLADLSWKVLSTTEKLTRVETEHMLTARENAELAKKMLSLAQEADTPKEAITDPSIRQQLDSLEESLRASKQRWRIMKGTTSGIVAGSGVDWTRDATLRELVLDHEDDD
ncbi:MAG: hypothetical protein M1818_005245 [Claussenomyces sp. TS43310]|nr:MAG: hypothetical protein M1818_005245 [Claussenomyces sp. TS43310]